MAYSMTDQKYYTNNGVVPQSTNWGNYQYVSLKDIVNNFELMFEGDESLVSKQNRYKLLFHAKRGIQEINYDALKNIKILEMDVCSNLKYVLPADYVNYVRISLFKNGILFPLIENFQTNYSSAYLQDDDCEVLFDIDGNALGSTSAIDNKENNGN